VQGILPSVLLEVAPNPRQFAYFQLQTGPEKSILRSPRCTLAAIFSAGQSGSPVSSIAQRRMEHDQKAID